MCAEQDLVWCGDFLHAPFSSVLKEIDAAISLSMATLTVFKRLTMAWPQDFSLPSVLNVVKQTGVLICLTGSFHNVLKCLIASCGCGWWREEAIQQTSNHKIEVSEHLIKLKLHILHVSKSCPSSSYSFQNYFSLSHTGSCIKALRPSSFPLLPPLHPPSLQTLLSYHARLLPLCWLRGISWVRPGCLPCRDADWPGRRLWKGERVVISQANEYVSHEN